MIRAVRDSDEAVVDDMVLRLSRSRPILLGRMSSPGSAMAASAAAMWAAADRFVDRPSR